MSDLCASPKWKKPSDIMKKHRKKRRQTQQAVSLEKNPGELADVLSTNNAFLQTNLKRRNPFSLDNKVDNPSKRSKPLNDNDDDTSDGSNSNVLFTILGNIEKKSGPDSPLQVETTRGKRQNNNFSLDEDDSRSHFDFIEKFFSAKKQPQLQKSEDLKVRISPTTVDNAPFLRHQTVPVDWSLKVKLRVISQNPLLWCTQIRTAEEAQGITQYVTGVTGDQTVGDAEKKSCFQKCCMYWMYPSMPWLKLFPRIVPDAKLRSSNATLLDDVVQSALQSDWTDSFTSVFHQLRAQQCPYFYVCTHQFSVLFRASGMCGKKGISALLTPTTRGFREALKSEDISFSMPVLDRRRSNGVYTEKLEGNSDCENQPQDTSVGTSKPAADEEEDDFIDTDEGASVWLESIGLDKKQFPSLDPKKVKIQREGFRVIDNRPESLVYVEGGDVQGLFNFLLNCRSCVASSGPQAGVPPTILAPTGFKGATLKSHKVKHSIVKQMDDKDGGIQQMHILEIMGPVLPHHILNFVSLFSDVQTGKFSMTFNTHEPTVPFNAEVTKKSAADESLVDREKMGLQEKKFDGFFNQEQISDRLTCIRELHCDGGSYSLAV